jgi:mannose-6-phosphate isomerase-like protein (cupin superfamily)
VIAPGDRKLPDTPDVIAPDGSEVRLLSATVRGSMAQFRLAPGQVSKAIVHRTVDEVWYVSAGRGRIWRKSGSHEMITQLEPGLSLNIPVGTAFQFRCDGDTSLDIIGVTMPPWPGDGEAQFVDGVW